MKEAIITIIMRILNTLTAISIQATITHTPTSTATRIGLTRLLFIRMAGGHTRTFRREPMARP
jgi:hypothetical protein